MSAQDELLAQFDFEGWEDGQAVLAAYRDEVLRKAAEKLRKQRDDGHDETKCVPWFMYGHAADLIDPDKEN